MALTELQIIKKLNDTGHLRRPFGAADSGPWPFADLRKLTLQDGEVREAMASYQAMHSAVMEPLVAKHHPGRNTSAVNADGECGPATKELFAMARCACPDYDLEGAEEAVGSGNWKSCHNIGNFHSCRVKLLSAPPSHIAPIWNQIWDRVVASYDELGLHFETTTGNDYNTTIDFVKPNGGWIGLAIVGQNQGCSSKIWARFDKNYSPGNLLSEWTTLVKHELGHNCGLSHSNGGVMNPYIMKGLPISWRDDPSYKLLTARFGGEPIPNIPKTYELVVGRLYTDGTFDKLMTLPSDSTSTGPFPTT